MKTNDFIEEARDLGLFVEENKNQNMIWIKTPYEDNYVGEVKTDEIGCRIFDESKRFPGISKLIYEYSMTPLEEREEEKKYHVKVNNPILKELADELDSFFLNRGISTSYFLADEDQENGYQTQFTQKEIDNFPDDVKEILPLCKQIEVTP